MKIIREKMAKSETDRMNREMLARKVEEMIEKGIRKDKVNYSLNTLDPCYIEIEHSPEEGLIDFSRMGTSLLNKSGVIGASGLIDVTDKGALNRAIDAMLGINIVTLHQEHYCVHVSKAWHNMQDENDDILIDALADVSASLISSGNEEFAEKLRNLAEMQQQIRECKTLHPECNIIVTLGSLTSPFDSYIVTVNDIFYDGWTTSSEAKSAVRALVKGYRTAKEAA